MSTHIQILLDNYRRCYETDLIPRGPEEADRLMAAPFVVLSHDTQADPVFNYGNRTAQALFEMDWERLTSLPSRYSAEPQNRDERARFLQEVRAHGFSDSYRGVRISASGKRFYIESARVWTLIDRDGALYGQAATFAEWTYL